MSARIACAHMPHLMSYGITYDMKTLNNDNQLIYVFNDFPYKCLNVFNNIHEYANYANKIIYIFDLGTKGCA